MGKRLAIGSRRGRTEGKRREIRQALLMAVPALVILFGLIALGLPSAQALAASGGQVLLTVWWRWMNQYFYLEERRLTR